MGAIDGRGEILNRQCEVGFDNIAISRCTAKEATCCRENDARGAAILKTR